MSGINLYKIKIEFICVDVAIGSRYISSPGARSPGQSRVGGPSRYSRYHSRYILIQAGFLTIIESTLFYSFSV